MTQKVYILSGGGYWRWERYNLDVLGLVKCGISDV